MGAGDFFSNNIIDPLRSTRRKIGNGLSDFGGGLVDAYEWLSGAGAVNDAKKQQLEGIQKAQGEINTGYDQARGLLTPYTQGAAGNWADMQTRVRSGAFTPQFQQYGGPMTSGERFAAPFQEYQGQMTSGNQLPQYQQFQGQSQFNAAARPERQAATAENVNMYMDPGYQFRLNQGLNAVQTSAAAKGLLGSSGTLNGIQDYAQGLASQEFGAAHNRFMTDQNNQQGDYQWDQQFGMNNFNQNFQNAYGMNRDANAWSAQNADRGQEWFNQDRAAGMQANQFRNNWSMDRANSLLNAFQNDRAAGMQQNQFQNNFNMQNAMNNYNMWDGMVNRGYNATGLLGDMSINQANARAGLLTNAADVRANSTLARSQANRALPGDLLDFAGKAKGLFG